MFVVMKITGCWVLSLELFLHTRHLAALKKQKKGLMQQLLTGKTRVPLDTPTPDPEVAP